MGYSVIVIVVRWLFAGRGGVVGMVGSLIGGPHFVGLIQFGEQETPPKQQYWALGPTSHVAQFQPRTADRDANLIPTIRRSGCLKMFRALTVEANSILHLILSICTSCASLRDLPFQVPKCRREVK